MKSVSTNYLHNGQPLKKVKCGNCHTNIVVEWGGFHYYQDKRFCCSDCVKEYREKEEDKG